MVDFQKKLSEMREQKQMTAEERKDHTAIEFGKYRGKTWNQIAKIDPKYVVWAYETILNRPTCSGLLYKECGGYSSAPRAQTIKVEVEKNNMNLKNNFDQYDDDIPF